MFDYGDVVGYFDKNEYLLELKEKLGITQEEVDDLWAAFHKEVKEKEVAPRQFFDDYAKKHYWKVDLNEITDRAAQKANKVYQDMQNLIIKLKQANYRIGLLSNVGEKGAKNIRKNGFYDPFDPVILSCEIGVSKPDPKAYLHLLTALQVPAEKCIFIDDKASNIDAAKALHIDGIHYISVEELVKELQKRGINLE